MHSHTGSDGLWLFAEDLVINTVHGCKVFHVGEEDIDFNNIID
jgi:hypothetical protein